MKAKKNIKAKQPLKITSITQEVSKIDKDINSTQMVPTLKRIEKIDSELCDLKKRINKIKSEYETNFITDQEEKNFNIVKESNLRDHFDDSKDKINKNFMELHYTAKRYDEAEVCSQKAKIACEFILNHSLAKNIIKKNKDEA